MWGTFLGWLRDNNLASTWSDVAGLTLSVVGFTATLIGVLKVRGAAVRAKEAAEQARDSIRLLDSIVDFAAAISTLEEIKRLHRQDNPWPMLPERYAAIRKHLISLRSLKVQLTDNQQAVVQNALANLSAIEGQVERSLLNGPAPKRDKLNALVSNDVDSLLGVLQDLKAARSGGPS